jgi:hypothetical protein
MDGVIDLDPCSCSFANRVVKAKNYYPTDGHRQPWSGNVFLNPPGGLFDIEHEVLIQKGCSVSGACGLPPDHTHKRRNTVSSAAFWWGRLAYEVTQGHVPRGIFLGFSIEILATAATVTDSNPLDYLHCVPRKRIPFDTQVGDARVSEKSPTHNSIIVGVGDIDPKKFANTFRDIGGVWKGQRL